MPIGSAPRARLALFPFTTLVIPSEPIRAQHQASSVQCQVSNIKYQSRSGVNVVIVDVNSIDFFWYKYDWNFEQRFIRNYLFKSSRSIEFSEWLSMYNEFNLNFKTLNYKEKFKYDEKKNTIIIKTFL